MGIRGKHKLADRWDRDSYVVIDMQDKNTPVYKVQKEFGKGSVKTLHRNMLLPFSAKPSISDLGSIPQRKRSKTESNDRTKAIRVQTPLSESESDSDSTEESAIFVPRYIPPHRRKRDSLKSNSSSGNGSAEGSTTIVNDSSHHDSLDTVRGSPSVSRTTTLTNVGTEGSFQADSAGNSGKPYSIVSDRNQSKHSIQPRRSGRTKQAPK